MTITQRNNEYLVSFSFNPKLIEDIKAIPGRRYDRNTKIWHIPVTESEQMTKLRRKYAYLSPTLQQGVEEVGEVAELPDLDFDLPLKRNLFAYQRKGVAYSLQKKRLIMGDQPGLGKSGQAIATIHGGALKGEVTFPCLVICPASLKENWVREWKLWTDRKAFVLTDSMKNTWPQYLKAGLAEVFIVNYESLKKFFVAEITKGPNEPLTLKHIRFKDNISLFKSVVIDELHRLKDRNTQQAKFTKGITIGKEWILGLTGTPVVNKPVDLMSQLAILDRIRDFGGYKAFLNRYCGGNGTGATNLKELQYKLANTCFYQRQKKDVLQDLPDKMRQIVLCDITTRKEYDDALRDLADYLKEYKSKTDAEVLRSMRGELMVQIGVCKNISARGKLNEVSEYINEVLEANEKLVVFVHQKEIVQALLKMYPHAVTITGSDSMEQRQKAVDGFQTNPRVNLIVCNMKAAGVGLTLTASSRVAFVELPWHAADADQCEDRCIAKGQLIMTKDGFKKVEDIQVGDKVYSARGMWRKVTDTWTKLERNKPFVTIKYKGFHEPLVVTSDHRIYVYDEYQGCFCYVEAQELDIMQHRLVFARSVLGGWQNTIDIEQVFGHDYHHRNGTTMPNGRVRNPKPKVQLSENLMYAFGWYLAEGWAVVSEDQGSFIAICGNEKKETDHILRIARIFIQEFGLDESKISIRSNDQNCVSAYIYSKNLALFFQKSFGLGSNEKCIPEFVFSADTHLIKSFLCGYYDGDGYVRKNTQQASTKSDKIAIGLCQLESLFGNPITLRKAAWGGWSFEYTKPEKATRAPLISTVDGHILFPIQEISIARPSRGNERVYDLTVERDESFTVGLAAVHNCHRIGQKDSVQCTYFLGHKTIDQKIYEIIEHKRNVASSITGSDDDGQKQIIDRVYESLFNEKA